MKKSKKHFSIKDIVRDATLAVQMHEGAKGVCTLRAQSERYNEFDLSFSLFDYLMNSPS